MDPGGIRTARPSNPISLNRYAYVNGDPVNYGDPSGRILVYAGGGLVLNCGDGDGIYDGTCTGTDGDWGGGGGGGGGCNPGLDLVEQPGCDVGGGSGENAGNEPQPCEITADELFDFIMNTPAYAQGKPVSSRPLAGYVNQIMADAVADNIDPRLLVAIAFVEGKWGGSLMHSRRITPSDYTTAQVSWLTSL